MVRVELLLGTNYRNQIIQGKAIAPIPKMFELLGKYLMYYDRPEFFHYIRDSRYADLIDGLDEYKAKDYPVIWMIDKNQIGTVAITNYRAITHPILAEHGLYRIGTMKTILIF